MVDKTVFPSLNNNLFQIRRARCEADVVTRHEAWTVSDCKSLWNMTLEINIVCFYELVKCCTRYFEFANTAGKFEYKRPKVLSQEQAETYISNFT